METQIAEIPVLQKSKNASVKSVSPASSCCSKPAIATACCTPSKDPEENDGACCAQPKDGSACCDK